MCYQTALKIREEIGLKEGIAESYRNLGKTAIRLRNFLLAKEYLDKGFSVEDFGAKNFDEADDYPDYAVKVAGNVVKSKSLGILVCGSAQGMCIAANKFSGIRAALVENTTAARECSMPGRPWLFPGVGSQEDGLSTRCRCSGWARAGSASSSRRWTSGRPPDRRPAPPRSAAHHRRAGSSPRPTGSGSRTAW